MSAPRTILVAAALLFAAAKVVAQDPTSVEPDLFLDEARFLEGVARDLQGLGLGPDGEYDGLDQPDPGGTGAETAVYGIPPTGRLPCDVSTVASARVAPPVSFDPTALVDLPFGIDNLDDPDLRYFLEFYTTEGRRRMSNWLARSGRYRERIEAELREAGAPPELVWVAAVESDFDPTVRSHAGALGMWQFMSQTGRARGLRIDAEVDQRLDFAASARAAGEYLVELRERFGSWPLALAAYNAGHGHVRRELREANATDFTELDDYGALYTDARRYALRVITIAIVDRNRAALGYDTVVPDDPRLFDEVEVPGGTRLSLLGEALDMSATELREWNNALVGNRTPTDRDAWILRIPPGSRDSFVAEFDRMRRRYGDAHELVALRFGETVEDVADRVGIPARVLRSINGLESTAASPYGAEIIVPTRNRDPDPSGEAAERVVVVPATRFAPSDRQRVFYRVNPGDELGGIARHFGVAFYDVAAWNDLDPDATLLSGLVLQLWIAEDFDGSDTRLVEGRVRPIALGSAEWVAMQEEAEAERQARRRTYTVRSGDTVGGIAARYDVRVADIVRWNDLDDDATILVGQELVVGR